MTESRLQRVMRLRGVVESPGPDAAAAAQRCLQCPFARLCDEALAEGKDVRLFCPNSHYIQALHSRSLEFG